MGIMKLRINTLFWLFLKQLIIFSFTILIEIMLFVAFLFVAINNGILLPANYSERYLEANKDKLAESEPFSEELIPYSCNYGIFDREGVYLLGNFKKEEQADAKDFIEKGYSKGYYMLIERREGYLVVSYKLAAYFASPTLRWFFPAPELMGLILFILIFIALIIGNALNLGRKLRHLLKPVQEEIEQIQTKELIIEQKNSKVKEFDDILQLLYEMKSALSVSLQKEWETEKERKKNISALAHDIKTPLTIIKGNAELILEEDKLEEIYQSADIIGVYSDKIERYIKLLIDETRDAQYNSRTGKVRLAELIAEICAESEAFCKASGIELKISDTIREEEALLDKDSIVRAVINLIKNAAEHTEQEKKVKVSFQRKEKVFRVQIEDYGKGFTQEALRYAKNQFYTEKTHRGEEHYGLGMYNANHIAERYNGGIKYYNKPEQTGAVVIFEVAVIIE
ncbi:MAG: two-component sensor histidine kinase [Anaerocolumna sp.]|jgi:signal transduction histidine kinase|nr:two-component sensor histidine kinase [Anaerocolumna sp.]